ncbi:putative 1,3-beta-glucan synthase [Helianthus anomalus]
MSGIRFCDTYLRVITPYFNEDVLFSMDALEKPNEDGVSIVFYLQKKFSQVRAFKN